LALAIGKHPKGNVQISAGQAIFRDGKKMGHANVSQKMLM
jgi:hypothetical protein